MMRNDASKNRGLEAQRMLDEQVKMQTILEMDVEDRFVDNLTSNIFVDNPETSLPRPDPHVSVSSTEDDSKLGSQVALQPYRSYRALSEIKELNALLTLADKRKSSSKSNEMLIRKSLVLSGSSPLLMPKDRMRAVRSCENMAKDRGSTEMDEFATMRANQPRVLIQSAATRKKQGNCEAPLLINLTSNGSECTKSRESCKLKEVHPSPDLDQTPHGSTYKIPSDSPHNTLDSNSQTVGQGSHCNTLQSSRTMSDSNTLQNEHQSEANGMPCQYKFLEDDFEEETRRLNDEYSQEGTRRSREDVIKWLHEVGDEDAQSVSSVEYRSSMCSSMNDLNQGELSSCLSTMKSETGEKSKTERKDNSLLGKNLYVSWVGFLTYFLCYFTFLILIKLLNN